MAKLFLVLFDILDRVADRRDLLCVLVGDLNIESLLELHDELYGVERIRTEVVGEACFGFDFRLFDSQLVYDDLAKITLFLLHLSYSQKILSTRLSTNHGFFYLRY